MGGVGRQRPRPKPVGVAIAAVLDFVEEMVENRPGSG
jgi:hypothetical protein